MIAYEEKREVLCSLAELYLDTRENSYISVNDGIMDSWDLDSASFLILMALTFSKEEAINIYSIDFEIDKETQYDFVDKEYKKITKSKNNKIKKGKTILDDAKSYYNKHFSYLDEAEFERITCSLDKQLIKS